MNSSRRIAPGPGRRLPSRVSDIAGTSKRTSDSGEGGLRHWESTIVDALRKPPSNGNRCAIDPDADRCWPRRSSFKASRWFPGGDFRSVRAAGAFRISSLLRARLNRSAGTPLTRLPPKVASVRASLKLRITVRPLRHAFNCITTGCTIYKGYKPQCPLMARTSPTLSSSPFHAGASGANRARR